MKTDIQNGLAIEIKEHNYSLSYSPEFIIVNNRKYIFNHSPVSLMQNEDSHFVIKNDLFDIYAVGKDVDEVEKDFDEEFNYLHQRLNSPEDKYLSDRFINIRNLMNYFVKDVSES
jgi:hypothetical protein